MRDFIVLSECLNFTKAAEKLHLTQPTLSKHVVAMEKELGCELLNRSRRNVALTKAGELFAATSMQIVEAYDDCQKRISELVSQTALRVAGVLYDPAISSIISIAASLLEAEGKPPIQYNYGVAEQDFVGQLMKDEIDVAIGYATTEQLEELELVREPLTRTRFVAVVTKTCPLAGRKEASIDQLRNLRFIKFADNYSICGWHLIEKVCNDHGFNPRSRTVLGRNNSSYLNTPLTAEDVLIVPNNLPQLRYLSDFSQVAVVPLVDDDANFRLYMLYKSADAERVASVTSAYNRARKIIINHGKGGILAETD